MAIAVGDVVRCSAILQDGRGQDVVNTFDIIVETAGDSGNSGFREDVLEWMTFHYTALADFLSSNCGYDRVEFYQRNGTEFLPPIEWTSPPTNTNASTELPFGTAAEVFWHSTRRGSMKKSYVGPSGENANDAGIINAGSIAALLVWAGVVEGPYTGANNWTFQLCMWSSVDATFYGLHEAQVADQWARQKRRKRGVGS